MAIDRGNGIVTPAVLADSYDLDGILAKYEEFDDLYLGKSSFDPTTDNDGDPLQAGALYFNTVTSRLSVYNGTQWESIGSTTLQVNNFTGNGSTIVYGLSLAPNDENATQVYIDGVYQQKNTYSVSSKNLTFSEAPPNLSDIEIMIITSFDIGETDAVNVSYNQGNTNAVATTVEAKLQETVSVKDFGAVGDGVTDDTTAIQNAINQAGNITLDGTFIISSKIQVSSDTHITQTKGSWIKNNDTLETTIEGRPSTDNGVFEVACGSDNITFEGLDIRGAWYGATQPYRDNNIGINIKGRWDQYRLSEAITGTSKNIVIKECYIEGFAQSGIIADQIDTFKAFNNKIRNCGRDGIRMYGCVDFLCDGNTIDSMSPGYDGVAPNLNVYGISATTVYQQPLSDYRASEKGVIVNNTITGCLTWKSLDTHGGRDILFSNNNCLNSHIGIGIDKGGLDNNGDYMPAARIVISNNILKNTQTDGNYKRAGITVFAHSNTSATIGQDITITGNYIDGFGGDTKDGGISISQQKNVLISGNIIKNSINAGVYLALTCEAVVINDNIFRNVTLSGAGNKQGVGTSSLVGDLIISANTFQADTTAFQPINVDSSTNNTIRYESSNRGINCDDVGGWNYSDGGLNSETIAYGLINSSGTLSSGYKLTSSYVSTGRYNITVSDGSWAKLFPTMGLYTGTTTAGSITIKSISGDTITVLTFDSAGSLKDTSFYIQVNGYK